MGRAAWSRGGLSGELQAGPRDRARAGVSGRRALEPRPGTETGSKGNSRCERSRPSAGEEQQGRGGAAGRGGRAWGGDSQEAGSGFCRALGFRPMEWAAAGVSKQHSERI